MLPQRSIKALIFDMDGVLVDSEPFHLEAFQAVMKRHGVTFTAQDNHEFLGRTDMTLATTMMERHHLDATPEAIVEEKEALLSVLLKKSKAQPGVMALLEKAHNQALPMAVASSATMPTIELVVDT